MSIWSLSSIDEKFSSLLLPFFRVAAYDENVTSLKTLNTAEEEYEIMALVNGRIIICVKWLEWMGINVYDELFNTLHFNKISLHSTSSLFLFFCRQSATSDTIFSCFGFHTAIKWNLKFECDGYP